MVNNIFTDKDRIFYINIDNEVYQCKFNNVILEVNTIPSRNVTDDTIVKINGGIVYINLNIAGIANNVSWSKKGNMDGFNPLKIYNTADDCINGYSPIFKGRDQYSPLSLSSPIITDIEKDFCPKRAFWKKRPINGDENHFTLKLYAYKWNGFDADEVILRSPCDIPLGGYKNSYQYPLYNLVTNKWLMDLDEYGKLFPTYEECVNNNHIKIHRF